MRGGTPGVIAGRLEPEPGKAEVREGVGRGVEPPVTRWAAWAREVKLKGLATSPAGVAAMEGEARRDLSFKSSTILFNGPATGTPTLVALPFLRCICIADGVVGDPGRLLEGLCVSGRTPLPFLISPSRKWPVVTLGVMGIGWMAGVVSPESPRTTVEGRKREATTMRLDLNDEVIVG